MHQTYYFKLHVLCLYKYNWYTFSLVTFGMCTIYFYLKYQLFSRTASWEQCACMEIDIRTLRGRVRYKSDATSLAVQCACSNTVCDWWHAREAHLLASEDPWQPSSLNWGRPIGCIYTSNRGSSVSIVTRLWAGQISVPRRDTFLFSSTSRRALRLQWLYSHAPWRKAGKR